MENLSNIKNKLLAEQVEDLLFQYILKTPVPVGERLPNEFKLGEIFGVGRSTVREAVKSLVSRGILEIRRGAGTYVISTATAKEDPLGLLKTDDKMGLALDLADVRMMLEPEIAQMAAQNATEEEIAALRELCDRVEDKIRRGDPYIEDDIRFHTFVAECSKNRVIQQLIPIIDTTVMMFVNVTHKKLTEETIRTHRQVVEAIAERDLIGARTAMMMHMTYNRDMIKKMQKEQR